MPWGLRTIFCVVNRVLGREDEGEGDPLIRRGLPLPLGPQSDFLPLLLHGKSLHNFLSPFRWEWVANIWLDKNPWWMGCAQLVLSVGKVCFPFQRGAFGRSALGRLHPPTAFVQPIIDTLALPIDGVYSSRYVPSNSLPAVPFGG